MAGLSRSVVPLLAKRATRRLICQLERGKIHSEVSAEFIVSLHDNAWNCATPDWYPFEDGHPGRDMLFCLHLSSSVKSDKDGAWARKE